MSVSAFAASADGAGQLQQQHQRQIDAVYRPWVLVKMCSMQQPSRLLIVLFCSVLSCALHPSHPSHLHTLCWTQTQCGGSELAVRAAKPVLSLMGKSVVHLGDAGAGQVAKICNNLVGVPLLGVLGDIFLYRATPLAVW